jgi:hypothetical protein
MYSELLKLKIFYLTNKYFLRAPAGTEEDVASRIKGKVAPAKELKCTGVLPIYKADL